MADNSKRSSPIQILVVECTSQLNWYKTFEGATFQGQPVAVEQADWNDIK